MNPTLNNSDAYRFLSIKAIPILAEIIEDANYKHVKPTASSKSSGSKIADVIFKFRDADKNLIETSPTIYYPDYDSIAISLHKMMYCKNILFVKDNMVYIVPQSSLLSIWNNKDICRIDKRTYQDGLGERSQLSRVDINWLMENASLKIEMTENHASRYHNALSEILS